MNFYLDMKYGINPFLSAVRHGWHRHVFGYRAARRTAIKYHVWDGYNRK